MSAGIGRSGTFCAVDIALKRLRDADLRDPKAVHTAINIKRIVTALRKQRPGMVQTFEQYLLCYQVRLRLSVHPSARDLACLLSLQHVAP